MRLNVGQQNQVTELVPMTRRLAEKFGRGLDGEEAEGVALMALCQAVPTYSPDHGLTLESFVRLSLINTLKHWRRDQVFERRRGLAGGAVMASEVSNASSCGRQVATSDEADQGGCSRDLARSLGSPDLNPETAVYWQELLDMLPQDIRPLAEAKWRQGKTQKEIAEEAGLSQSQVSRRIQRAEHYARLYLNGGGV